MADKSVYIPNGDSQITPPVDYKIGSSVWTVTINLITQPINKSPKVIVKLLGPVQ